MSNILSVVMAFGIAVGHITSGLLYDKFSLGTLMNTAVGVVCAGMVCLSLLTVNSPALLLIFAMICIGYANALTLSTLSHMINCVFAAEQTDFSGLFGCLFAIQNIGVIIGSPISGMFFDRTGSYPIYYIISAVLLVIMLILLHIALKLGKQQLQVK